MSLEQVFDYFRKYDKTSFYVASCKGNEPSELELTKFESMVGFRLPEQFRQFTKSSLGGLYMEVREELWPPAKAHAVGPFWSFLRGLMVFGIAQEIPEWLDIRVQYRRFSEKGHDDVVPFLKVEGDADWYCFRRSGEVVQWDHELDTFEAESLSFSDLFLREIRELEERKDRKLRG